MLLFPITLNYLSPYLIIRGSFEGVLAGSGVLFAGLFLSSLFFGRAFCGWVCPAGALQDVCTVIEGKVVKRRMNMLKYLLWVPWLGAIAAGFISAGGLRKIDVIYYTDYGISVNAPSGYVIYFTVVLLIVVLSLVLGRRSFCHSVCWMAPFMVLSSGIAERLHIPSLRLKAEPTRCIGCARCDQHCPMSIGVHEMVVSGKMFDRECTLCGTCADVCPKKAIRLGFK